jgi:hypothetical protein
MTAAHGRTEHASVKLGDPSVAAQNVELKSTAFDPGDVGFRRPSPTCARAFEHRGSRHVQIDEQGD